MVTKLGNIGYTKGVAYIGQENIRIKGLHLSATQSVAQRGEPDDGQISEEVEQPPQWSPKMRWSMITGAR